MSEIDKLLHQFMHHPPTAAKVGQHESVRGTLMQVADWFRRLLPEGPEKEIVFTKLREAMMWANASIALDQPAAIENLPGTSAVRPDSAPAEQPVPAPEPVAAVIPAQPGPVDAPAPVEQNPAVTTPDPAAAPQVTVDGIVADPTVPGALPPVEGGNTDGGQ